MSRRGRSFLATTAACLAMGFLTATASTPEPVTTVTEVVAAAPQPRAARNCSSRTDDALDQAGWGSVTLNSFHCVGAPDAPCGTPEF
jgi:hypothetical protein